VIIQKGTERKIIHHFEMTSMLKQYVYSRSANKVA